jgi:hypothetical protein
MGSAVTRYGHIAWRATAAVAFAGTAALAVALSRAPARPERASLSSNLSSSPCAASGLEAWLGLATTGSAYVTGTGDRVEPGRTYYTLEFTNVSARACSLYGYPEVSAYAGGHAGGGSQIGSAATWDTSVRPQSVTLAPGQTAHSVLRVTSTQTFLPTACAQVTASELRVMLPDQVRPSFVPIDVSACSKRGPQFLTVQPIQPRAGVPEAAMP